MTSGPSKQEGKQEWISSDLQRLRDIVGVQKDFSEASEEVLEATMAISKHRNALAGLLPVSPVYFAEVMGIARPILPGEEYLKNAFAFFELDPQVPQHWVILLRSFAFLHFEERQPGAKEQWDNAKLYDLACDIHELQSARPDVTSNRAIAEALTREKRFKPKYGQDNPDTLRKRVSKAKSPAFYGSKRRPARDPASAIIVQEWVAKGKIRTQRELENFLEHLKEVWKPIIKRPSLLK